MHHLKFHWSMSRKEKVIKLGASGTEESGNWVCKDRIIFIGELEERYFRKKEELLKHGVFG